MKVLCSVRFFLLSFLVLATFEPAFATTASVSVGEYHQCFLSNEGVVTCSGRNIEGQLGNGKTGSLNSSLVRVNNLFKNVASISAGGYHTCALSKAGQVNCWGLNSKGQLGNNSTKNASAPVAVKKLSGVTAISAGRFHTCALTKSGSVKCWGANASGQLGNYSNRHSEIPVSVRGLDGKVIAITAGDYHTCALTTAGAVKCWGRNNSGQLGEDVGGYYRSVPTLVKGLESDVIAIDAGSAHNCALNNLGKVICWGQSIFGQLGVFQREYLTSVDLNNVTAISSGGNHSCALTDVGSVFCWGSTLGSLSAMDMTEQNSHPSLIESIDNEVKFISSGFTNNCAITSDDSVKCWSVN